MVESKTKTPEEYLEEAKKLIGRETEPVEALYPIEHEPIRRFQHMTGDDNPLYIDPEHGKGTPYRGTPCPPLGMTAVTMFPGLPIGSPFPPPAQELPQLPPLPAPGDLGFVLGTEWEFLKPVMVGDHLSVTNRYGDVYIKGVRIDPKAFFVVQERIFRNQRQEVVAVSRMTLIRHRSPEQLKAAGEA